MFKIGTKIYLLLLFYTSGGIILTLILAREYNFFYLITSTIIIFYIFSALLIFSVFRKKIIRPLRAILSSLIDIARYNVPQRIKIETKDEMGLLASALNQVIFNLAGHKEILEEKLQGLHLLADILSVINSDIRFSKVMQTALNRISRALFAEEVIIFIKNEEDALIVFFSSGEVVNDIPDIRFKIGEGIAGLAAKSGESIIVNDTTRDERFKEIEGDKKIHSLICVPLKVKEETIGVLSLANKKSGVFQENDKIFLETLAPSLAIAIDNARLWEVAITDELSGLYTYRYFKYILEYEFKRAKRYSQPLSLIFADIDFFKKINDNFGHQVGDGVIQKISKIIKEKVRIVDIACRYGGEEFAIILPQTDKYGAKILADRIRKEIEDTKIQTPEGEISWSASFGVGDNFSITDWMELVRQADKALYKAKEGGRNQVILWEW